MNAVETSDLRVADLIGAVGEQGLLRLVLQAVQTVEWPAARAESGPCRTGGLRPQVLLTLLTYCYAAGFYGSQEIQERIPYHPMLRYVCAGAAPTWHQLRAFRRSHRVQLAQALAAVLSSVWLRCSAADQALEAPGGSICRNAEMGAQGQECWRLLAEARLDRAVLLDSVALDW